MGLSVSDEKHRNKIFAISRHWLDGWFWFIGLVSQKMAVAISNSFYVFFSISSPQAPIPNGCGKKSEHHLQYLSCEQNKYQVDIINRFEFDSKYAIDNTSFFKSGLITTIWLIFVNNVALKRDDVDFSNKVTLSRLWSCRDQQNISQWCGARLLY